MIASLKERGYEMLRPSQANTFEAIYSRENVIARDLTGTGKTLGFCLPLVERFRKEGKFGQKNPLALMLAPTRELALQITGELEKLKLSDREFKVVTVYGGQSIQGQLYELNGSPSFVVGTTGRVMDFIQRDALRMEDIEVMVLDEADRMLDMGFKEDVEKIVESLSEARTGQNPQIVLFSATMPPWITKMAESFM
jgi:superfamily II DNA/RNA helicase